VGIGSFCAMFQLCLCSFKRGGKPFFLVLSHGKMAFHRRLNLHKRFHNAQKLPIPTRAGVLSARRQLKSCVAVEKVV